MGYNEGIGKVWLSTHDAVGQIVAAKTCGRLINLAVGIRHIAFNNNKGFSRSTEDLLA